MDASKSLLDGFLEVVPSLLELFGVFKLSKCTSAWLSSSPKECMRLDEVSNMSRISVLDLSFDSRAKTIEKVTTFAVSSSWFCMCIAWHSLNSVFDMQNLVLPQIV